MGFGELVGQVVEVFFAGLVVVEFGDGGGEVGAVLGGVGLRDEQVGLELFAEAGEQCGAGVAFDACPRLLLDGGEPRGVQVD